MVEPHACAGGTLGLDRLVLSRPVTAEMILSVYKGDGSLPSRVLTGCSSQSVTQSGYTNRISRWFCKTKKKIPREPHSGRERSVSSAYEGKACEYVVSLKQNSDKPSVRDFSSFSARVLDPLISQSDRKGKWRLPAPAHDDNGYISCGQAAGTKLEGEEENNLRAANEQHISTWSPLDG
ncbi:hypothetical protein DAPPUDRAFT_238490 [Daphnia pulex]|uniref:Uncharacterized protein n=1 Tax=Daphnia pulex TaxID=6669 RepID=E9G6J8_DAPPU|nr:hypothetical protein DAPPUDRAFT_238490 [Daphnia pulex]|eukprot:EFX84978.1 hypothetical protein DAPPUDRAFT_238490 [Daphnia pulex]